eukprot:364785-Chlamydomonas_euryale.AAC.7
MQQQQQQQQQDSRTAGRTIRPGATLMVQQHHMHRHPHPRSSVQQQQIPPRQHCCRNSATAA